jgi:peptidyl-prolyl cis-trans isomerase B (cyclophilin B)
MHSDDPLREDAYSPVAMPTNKRERQRENRAKKLEEQKKRERQLKLRKRVIRITILVALLAVALLLPTILGNSEDATTTTAALTVPTTTAPPTTLDPAALPSDYDGYRAQPTACGAEAPPPVAEMTFAAAEDQAIAADATVTATLTTSCGDIVLELDPALAPQTVNSFVFLARQGYFDGSVFHRIADWVLQGGDPSGTGGGGPGYAVPDEYPPADFSYEKGTVAMANSGQPGTTGSQFFVMLADRALPPQYSVFGRVRDSDETLQRIVSVPVGLNTNLGEQSLPLESVYIESVEIEVGS